MSNHFSITFFGFARLFNIPGICQSNFHFSCLSSDDNIDLYCVKYCVNSDKKLGSCLQKSGAVLGRCRKIIVNVS